MSDSRIRTLVLVGIFAALAFVVTVLVRPTFNEFLTFDFKDTIIGIAGFLLGPLVAVAIACLVATLEMFISGTGLVGLIMNIVATVGFAGVAAWIYTRKPSLRNAAIGVVVGTLVMTAAMLVLNYLITPIYQGVPRPVVAAMLVPVFLPFNLLKGGANALLIMLLYKPVMRALSAIGIADEADTVQEAGVSQHE